MRLGQRLAALAAAAAGGLRRLARIAARGLRSASRIAAACSRSAAVRRGAGAVRSVARHLLAVGAVAALAAGLLLGVLGLGFQRVPAGAIGVRQTTWGGAGIEARDYTRGLYVSIRGLHAWHLLDRRTHLLTFAWSSEGGADDILHVRTKDGNVARVAAFVPYRIRPGEGHRLVADGLKERYREQARVTVEKVLLAELANLSSEDLVSTEVRLARTTDTLPLLNQRLAALHLEAETIQLTLVLFPLAYEKKLQEKQLTAQEGKLAAAAAQVEEELRPSLLAREIESLEKETAAEWDKRIEELRAERRAEIARVALEADVYDKERRSQAQAEHDAAVAAGDLELARAEALRAELQLEAYAGEGGRIALARKAAENLNIRSVVLDSRDPRVPLALDLDQLVRLLVGAR